MMMNRYLADGFASGHRRPQLGQSAGRAPGAARGAPGVVEHQAQRGRRLRCNTPGGLVPPGEGPGWVGWVGWGLDGLDWWLY